MESDTSRNKTPNIGSESAMCLSTAIQRSALSSRVRIAWDAFISKPVALTRVLVFEQILLLKFNAMTDQKVSVFIFKRDFDVMHFLVSDVTVHIGHF